MKKIIIILFIFFLDRASKIYLLNLEISGTTIDFYINPFLNLYLVWNTGIGFGLMSFESNIMYHMLTAIILIINIKVHVLYMGYYLIGSFISSKLQYIDNG